MIMTFFATLAQVFKGIKHEDLGDIYDTKNTSK